ncbi:MAG: hypothetical protein Q8M22_07095 [Actinomycetota bacterium]|nr:hypothetical protein [Actinomycetota bacterium]
MFRNVTGAGAVVFWTGMTRHRTSHRFAVAAILGLALLNACSSNTQRETLPSSSTVATTSTVESTTTTNGAPETTVAPATTEPAPTPTAPPPPPTIPPNLAPNPEPECVQPGADSEPVELVITDDGVLFEGVVVPPCMGVPESFRFRFTNNAEGDATVQFGDGEAVIAAGESVLSDPLGEMFFVGETFQIGVTELDTSLSVLVLAMA